MVDKIHIMGIVNLTPDSFFAGSRAEAQVALRRIRAMFEEGADVVDIGACSTRPGSEQPALEEEWARLAPVLRALRPGGMPSPSASLRDPVRANAPGEGIPPGYCISIDTYRAEIVRRAYETIGPFIVNDISAGQMDTDMLKTVGRLGLPYVAMHMRGTPQSMQNLTDYDDVTKAVIDYFKTFEITAEDAGIKEWILDPGFGFSKTKAQNFELLRRLNSLAEAFPGREVLVGVSRKSMIYKTLGITPEEAMPGTQVLQFAALERGARWLRVHDVAEAVRTATLYSTMYMSSPGAAK